MDLAELEKIWEREASLQMHGWDFKHLDGRWSNEHLPWDFHDLVKKYLTSKGRLLDMCTGGGELLLSYRHPASLTEVTESWEPNIEFLQKRLVPRGIKVHAVAGEEGLPVSNDSFSLITNSHGAFDPKTVHSKLKQGGYFITEQVGATNNFSLSRYLDPTYAPSFPDNTLLQAVTGLRDAGFKILFEQQAFPEMKFFDVGAVVYYAAVIPWEFHNFSVQSSFEKLVKLQKMIEQEKFITTNEDRFVIVAKKV